MTRTVVVLNSGECTGLNFTRSLHLARGWKVIGIDSNVDEYHNSEADQRNYVPWNHASELLEAVNAIAAREQAALLYVADTGTELMTLSRQRSRVDAPMLLPSLDAHELMEDKWLTYLTLRDVGLPVPDTALARSMTDLDDLFSRHGTVWLRRVRGSAGAGSVPTSSKSFASAWLDEYEGWGSFTIAECLSKRTATFSGLWFEGELIASQLRERVAWKYQTSTPSGVSGVTGSQKTIWDADLHSIAIDAVRACCDVPHGAIGVDFTYGQNDCPMITEVQPSRFYSSIHFLARVGINFPDLFCKLALYGRSAVETVINPIRDEQYWLKSVDRLPQLMSAQEFMNHEGHSLK